MSKALLRKHSSLLSISAAAAVAVSGLAFSPPALAQQQPVLVVSDPDIVTRRISYADLNLASSPGQSTLNRRVGGAILSLCRDITRAGGSDFGRADRKCRADAWGQARPQMANAVQRARDIAFQGTSPVAVSAITLIIAK